MGAGKTTISSALGARLGWAVVDSDREIEARTGSSVADMWAAGEVDRFRALESEVLAEALASSDPVVVAAAGGVVLAEANRRILGAHWPVVWLRASTQTLIERVGDGAGRPLLAGDPVGAVIRLDAERRPFYREVADVVVDVDGRTAEEVVDVVMVELGLPGQHRR